LYVCIWHVVKVHVSYDAYPSRSHSGNVPQSGMRLRLRCPASRQLTGESRFLAWNTTLTDSNPRILHTRISAQSNSW
jgi:hypothetical protein